MPMRKFECLWRRVKSEGSRGNCPTAKYRRVGLAVSEASPQYRRFAQYGDLSEESRVKGNDNGSDIVEKYFYCRLQIDFFFCNFVAIKGR